MLFDLRSRGRRTTVRVIYVLLALVMVGGLLLVGVGTGNNQGGLLNAFTNNGSGGSGNAAADNAVRKAVKETRTHPNSPSSWSGLVSARWSAAGQGNNFDSSTETYTASGKHQLRLALQAWNKYLSLTNHKPSLTIAHLAAEASGIVGQWSTASTAWEYVANDEESAGAAQAYLCLAFTSLAAGDTRKGELAGAQAVKSAPKLQKLTLQQDIKSAKSNKTTAQQYAQQDC